MGSQTFAHDLITGDPFASMRRKEKAATNDLLAEQDRMNNELLNREKELESKLEGQGVLDAARDEARKRQRQRARGAGGRSSTILTSPLGDVGEQSVQRNTILGG